MPTKYYAIWWETNDKHYSRYLTIRNILDVFCLSKGDYKDLGAIAVFTNNVIAGKVATDYWADNGGKCKVVEYNPPSVQVVM